MKPPRGALAPRNKLLLAVGLVLGLAVLASMREFSLTALARVVLGGGVLVGLGWWVRRGRGGSRFERTARLEVVSRAGLSPRCGLALVEVDGSSYLVAFGDSFAEIQRTRGPVRLEPRSRRRVAPLSVAKERLS